MAEAAVAQLTVHDVIGSGCARLAAAGCDTPRLDAELLLARALGHDSRALLVLDARAVVEKGQLLQFDRLLERRQRREPVAYILGRRDFRGISVCVDRRVLIPRPETELLVEAALGLPRDWSVADVGTGSGAVALALKAERPELAVTGIDADPKALEVARGNRERLGLAVEFICADLLDADRYDAVVANLPYVRRGERLAPEIAWYEPPYAVYGGEDGLEPIRRLASRLARAPRTRFVALEVGVGQARAVSAVLRGAGFASIDLHRDLGGHERVVVGRR